jgi:hypothetical protein
MKTKVSEASGPVLDWMVAKANQTAGLVKSDPMLDCMSYFTPSTNWSQGGPILQNHISELIDCSDEGWEACCNGTYGATGDTALIAVCRAYVASKLGEEVEVPDELI